MAQRNSPSTPDVSVPLAKLHALKKQEADVKDRLTQLRTLDEQRHKEHPACAWCGKRDCSAEYCSDDCREKGELIARYSPEYLAAQERADDAVSRLEDFIKNQDGVQLGFTAVGSSAEFAHSDDYRSIRFKGLSYSLTVNQAKIIELSSTVGSEAWNSRDLKSRPH